VGKDAEATLLIRVKQAGQAVLDHFVVTFGDLVEIAKKVGEALLEPLEQFKAQEKAINALNTAMVAQGIYSRELSQKYQDMAKSLQQVTTYGDDQIIQAQAQLQSFLGTTKVTEKLTMAVLDLATAKKMDLTSAAEKVGRAISSSTNALAREGIAVDVTATKQERLAQVITGIEGKWKDQAKAAASGLGVWDQLKKDFEDLEKTLGERLAPIVVFVGQQLRKFAEDTRISSPIIDGMVTVIAYLVKTVSLASAEIQNLGTSFGAFAGSAAGAIDQLVHGKFKDAWQTMKDGSAQADKDVAAIWQAHAERVTAIDEMLLERRTENSAKEEQMLRQSAQNKTTIMADQNAIDHANSALRNDQELLDTQLHLDELKNLSLSAQLERINAMLIQEQSATMQNALEQRKRVILTQMGNEELKRSEQALFDFRKARRQAEVQDQATFFNTVQGLSSSNSKALAAIGKAAAITQIAIKTPEAAASSFAFGASIGGPILGSIFEGVAIAAMAAQAAQVAGVPLAEGGIVRATPGGVPAIIGEGGRDEAVIPLDSPDAAGRLGGGGNTFVFNGPVMGDRSQAQEFARMVDRELLQLRRSGESLAFDSRVT
jgi:hypothetical protein